MTTLKKDVKLVSPILQDIYRKLLSKSAPQNRLHDAFKLALTEKETFKAFILVQSDVTEATTIKDDPTRIDLSLYPSGTMSIFNAHGNLGKRLLDYGNASIKKLTLECAPIWVRGWLRTFINHDRLTELKIGPKVEKASFPILVQIAQTTKKLIDETGEVVPQLKGGQFDVVYIEKLNFSWPENFFANMKFTTNCFKCKVNEKNWFRLEQVRNAFANISNDKLSSIKSFHITFSLSPRQNRNFQPFVDTIAEVMPNVKTIFLDLETPEVDLTRSYKFLPGTFGRIYESFQQLIPPPDVKVNIRLYCLAQWIVHNAAFHLSNHTLNVLGCMRKVPIDETVKVSTSTRSLENEKNRYQKWVFDAGNEMGPQKGFSLDLIIYAMKL